MAKSQEKLSPLEGRIETFFRVQPFNDPSDVATLLLDLSKDLKKLVSAEDAEEACKAAEAKNIPIPGTKADRGDIGRELFVNSVIDKLKAAGTLRPIKMESGGMGLSFSGERNPDRPEDQEGKTKSLRIDQIKIDKGIQQRDGGVNEAVVEKYTENADRLPPLRVFHEKKDGKDVYLLSRGFHRIAAMNAAGMQMVPVEVFEGDRHDAILDAIGDNSTHGLPRTDKDIRKAVGTLLGSQKYKNASVCWIADTVHIAWATANKIVKTWLRENNVQRGPVEGRDGKSYEAPKGKEKDAAKADPNKEAPAKGTPSKEVPDAPPTAGFKDTAGQDVPAGTVAQAFLDKRIPQAVKFIQENIDWLREIQFDGYTATAIDMKGREEMFKEIEYYLDQLRESAPFAVCPKAPGKQFAAAARRGWMTQAEWSEYAKIRDKEAAKDKGKAKDKEPEPATAAA